MRLLFYGSGEFGLPTLGRLGERHELAAVISQPDRPAGRRQQLAPTPIAQWAQGRASTAGAPSWPAVPVLKSDDVNQPAFVEQVRRLGADAAVVIAFGQKLSPALLEASGKLALNLHASLLPRYRGAAPINWAIIQGEAETGVSVISLSQRMDGGPVYAQSRTPIGDTETAGELHDRLAAMGPDLVEQVLREFEAGTLTGQPQDEAQASKAPKLSKADAVVDFAAAAGAVARRINGLNPWPGVKARWYRGAGDVAGGQELFLRRAAAGPLAAGGATDKSVPPGVAPGVMVDSLHVAAGGGLVRILEVQLPGGRVMPMEEFVRGHRIAAGDRLGA